MENEFVSVNGLIAKKNNIVYVRKNATNNEIEFCMNNGQFCNQMVVNFNSEAERDKTFNKIMVALTGDFE